MPDFIFRTENLTPGKGDEISLNTWGRPLTSNTHCIDFLSESRNANEQTTCFLDSSILDLTQVNRIFCKIFSITSLNATSRGAKSHLQTPKCCFLTTLRVVVRGGYKEGINPGALPRNQHGSTVPKEPLKTNRNE